MTSSPKACMHGCASSPSAVGAAADGRRGGGWLVGTSSGGGGGASGAGPARSPSSATGGKLSSVRAEDLRLRAPRGLLAHARAGEPARLELLAPLLGGGRVELPGRMRCVLHLRSPWYDPAAEAEPVEHVAVEETVQGGAAVATPRGAGNGRKKKTKTTPTTSASSGTDSTRGGDKPVGEFFSGRIAFAPHAMQPGTHQLQPPPGYAPPTGYAPPSVFDNALASASASHASHSPMRIEDASLRVQMSSKLKWGGESASLGGTLLLATFAVPRAGSYLVHVTFDQAHITGSPLLLRVAPSAAVGRLSEAVGRALSVAEAGRHETVRVWLRDRYGNARRISDDPPAGELTAELELLTAHDALFVDYDNALEQRQQRHLDALQQMARGGTAGHRGWHRHNGGGGDGEADHIGGIGEYRPSVVSSARATASVSALADGSFAVGYTVRQAGVWALSIGLEGEQIAKSPFAVTVWPGKVHAPACDVTGDLHAATAGVMAEIQITARDRFGNRIRDGGVPLSLAVLPMDEPNRAVSVQGEVQDHSDGRYTARYTVTTAGRHALSLTIAPDDAPLHGSPYLLLVAPSPPHAARCACFAPAWGMRRMQMRR